MLPPDPFIECDETWVRFEWPAFRVLTAEKQRLRVNCEVYHGAFDVCFEVVEVDDGGNRQVMVEFSLSLDSLERMVKIARIQSMEKK